MDTLKVVSFLTRRADFSQEAFSQYWRTTHKAHALKLVDAGFFRGYVQNHVIEPDLDGLARRADGAPELWIDDVNALQRLVESHVYREGAGPDEALFMIPPAVACVARERRVTGSHRSAGELGGVKLMRVVRRQEGIDREDFARRWLSGDERIWPLEAPLLRLTRQSVVADIQSPFDGVECTWWPDECSARAAWRELAPAARVEATVEASSAWGLLVREEVVQAPPDSV